MPHAAHKLLLVAALLLLPQAAARGQNEDITVSDSTRPAERDTRFLLVRHAVIRGRVFFTSERQGQPEEPASGVLIQVKVPETGEVVAKTATDKEGSYILPQVDLGIYHLMIGKLQLNMKVIAEAEEVGELPKVIICVLPREMAR